MISWSFKKQSLITRSSAKSECQALSSASAQLIWQQIFCSLKFGYIAHRDLQFGVIMPV